MPNRAHAQPPDDHATATERLADAMPLPTAAFLVDAAHAQLAHAQRALSAALEQRARTPGRKPAECGTLAGYRRHQRAGDVPCFACIEGKSWDERRRARRTTSAA